jgi:hypothetical protein
MNRKTLTFAALAFLMAGTSAIAQSIVYAIDLRATPNRLLNWPVNASSTAQVTVTSANASYDGFAIDFNTAGSILYGINPGVAPFNFGTIDLLTGNFNLIAPLGNIPAGNNPTGLRADPTTDTFYFSSNGTSGNTLQTLNIATGLLSAPVVMTGLAAGAIVIDIAISNSGQMYGIDIGSDTLISIDKVTGATTTIGPLGFNANFAQGMDFDMATNTLYATIYTGGGTGVFASINLATGAATQLFATTPLNAEMEMAIRPIPEPTTLALLGLGAVGLAWRLRRKK